MHFGDSRKIHNGIVEIIKDESLLTYDQLTFHHHKTKILMK